MSPQWHLKLPIFNKRLTNCLPLRLLKILIGSGAGAFFSFQGAVKISHASWWRTGWESKRNGLHPVHIYGRPNGEGDAVHYSGWLALNVTQPVYWSFLPHVMKENVMEISKSAFHYPNIPRLTRLPHEIFPNTHLNVQAFHLFNILLFTSVATGIAKDRMTNMCSNWQHVVNQDKHLLMSSSNYFIP